VITCLARRVDDDQERVQRLRRRQRYDGCRPWRRRSRALSGWPSMDRMPRRCRLISRCRPERLPMVTSSGSRLSLWPVAGGCSYPGSAHWLPPSSHGVGGLSSGSARSWTSAALTAPFGGQHGELQAGQ
jgi:hypothetical protein